MIRFEKQARDQTGALVMINEYRGLSSETKPTACSVGSVFHEIDTGTTFAFDGESWDEQAGGGSQPELFPPVVTGGYNSISWATDSRNVPFDAATQATLDGVAVTSPLTITQEMAGKTLVITTSAENFKDATQSILVYYMYAHSSLISISKGGNANAYRLVFEISDTSKLIPQGYDTSSGDEYFSEAITTDANGDVSDALSFSLACLGSELPSVAKIKVVDEYNEIVSGEIAFTITKNGESVYSTNVSGAAEINIPDTISFETGDDLEVIVNAAVELVSPILNDNDWSVISAVSAAGNAANYWAVGDVKMITLNGTVGTLSLNNVSLGVFILGFNHNSAVEGTGISFGTFKTAISSGKDVALCDSHYGSSSTNGSKWFNMNHSANTNSGGWKGCDMRYDILGSVEVKNQQNATSVATSSPVANTLMAALPSALRAVMKPITKYTDNVGGTNVAANVTTTVDYLPLLAEYEIFGSRTYANSAEQLHQVQYAFYANGGSKVKYNHSNTSSTVGWWERSARYDGNVSFCRVNDDGSASADYARYSRGVAPIFLV